MKHPRLLLCFLTFTSALAGAACGGNVQQSSSGETGTTTTGTTSGTTSTGNGGSTSTVTGSGGCNSSMDLVVDNGAPQHLTSICVMPGWNPTHVTTPIGYFIEGGVSPGVHNLRLDGCQSAAVGALGIDLTGSNVEGPGTFTMGAATYAEPGTGDWTTMNDTMTKLVVTKLGAVGDTIEGTFQATVSQPNKANSHLVSGSFHVCHTEDEAVP